MKEKEAALERQWQECEKLKEEAVAVACEALARKLRAEFAIEKEQAVNEALRIAKVGQKLSVKSVSRAENIINFK